MKEQFCILIASSRTCPIDCGKEDTKHVTMLNKDYAVLVGGRCGTAEWIRAMGLQIGTILADRKLFIQSRCDFYLFATSIAFGSPEEFVKRVPKEYRRRWKIETGYRVKKEFKIINDLLTVLRHPSALLRRSCTTS